MVESAMVGAGHNHLCWRDFDGDFGRNILAEHIAEDVAEEAGTSQPPTPAPAQVPTPAPTTPAPPTLALAPSAPTPSGGCPVNCGQPARGGGTCRATGQCLSCNADRLRVNGRCALSLSCRGRRVQSGMMTGQGCRCLDDRCHSCQRTVSRDTCRVCRDGAYLLDAECVAVCPVGLASSGVGLFKRRCAAPFVCQTGRLVGLDVSYGCKCAAENNLAIAHCQLCEHRAGEYGQHCLRCNNRQYLYENRCRENCDGLRGLGNTVALAHYTPGTYGRECRVPFTCTNQVDEQGDACACSRTVGRSDCAVCE